MSRALFLQGLVRTAGSGAGEGAAPACAANLLRCLCGGEWVPRQQDLFWSVCRISAAVKAPAVFLQAVWTDFFPFKSMPDKYTCIYTYIHLGLKRENMLSVTLPDLSFIFLSEN